MTTSTVTAQIPLDGLSDLAVADPANDLLYEHVMGRLDGALDRIGVRLRGNIGEAAHGQLSAAAGLLARLPQMAKRAVLSHPYFMYWMVKQYERCVAGDRVAIEVAMLDIGRFVAIPALRHGIWHGGDSITLRGRAGQLRFPGHRTHLLLPSGAAEGAVELRLDGDTVRAKSTGVDIQVPVDELLGQCLIRGGSPLAVRPVIPGTSIEIDSTDPFVGELFASMNSRPPLPNYPPRDLAPMPGLAPNALESLSEVCQLIAEAWPAAFAELMHYTRVFVPFVSRCHSTFAEAAFLGAVFMGESRHQFTDVMFTAEHLFHEHSHLRLHLIMEQDPVFEADGDQLVESPWRRDPRPVIGIVQGVFVFARVARLLRYAYHLRGDERYATRRQAVVDDLRAGLQVLRDAPHVRFTPLGAALFDQCEEEAHTPVSAERTNKP